MYANFTGTNTSLQEHFTQGTVCDLTGLPRVTNVSYLCQAAVMPNIVSVQEPSSCAYSVIIGAAVFCPVVNKTSSDVVCWPVDAAGNPAAPAISPPSRPQSAAATGDGTASQPAEEEMSATAEAAMPTAVTTGLAANSGWDGYVSVAVTSHASHHSQPPLKYYLPFLVWHGLCW